MCFWTSRVLECRRTLYVRQWRTHYIIRSIHWWFWSFYGKRWQREQYKAHQPGSLGAAMCWVLMKGSRKYLRHAAWFQCCCLQSNAVRWRDIPPPPPSLLKSPAEERPGLGRPSPGTEGIHTITHSCSAIYQLLYSSFLFSYSHHYQVGCDTTPTEGQDNTPHHYHHHHTHTSTL